MKPLETAAMDRGVSEHVRPRRSGSVRGLSAVIGAALYFAAATGCAAVPKPPVLAEVAAVRRGPTAIEAKTYAPGGFAHAEKLQREAEAAFEAGDTAGAQILGERALAAYAHAGALARIARADAGSAESHAALTKSKTDLASIDADQARVSAEISAIELRVKVATDAQPVVPSGPADPEREKARLAAARSLALQGRLLCGAARLLLGGATDPSEAVAAPPGPGASSSAPSSPAAGPPASSPAAGPPASPIAPSRQKIVAQLDEATRALEKLDADLASASLAPIDQASRARVACLAVLTGVRRAATPVSKAPGSGDTLLAELSAAGSWSPSRDERGVAITLRGLFKGNALTPAATTRLAELGRIAAAHPAFPVVVVLHQDKALDKKDEAAWKARGDLIVRSLKAERAGRVETVLAGAVAPVVDPSGADRARNARVEIVFVTPETF